MSRYITIALNDVGIPGRTPGMNPDYHLFWDQPLWMKYRDSKLHKRTYVVCQNLLAKRFKRYNACTFKDKLLIFSGMTGFDTIKPEDDTLHVRHTISTGGVILAWKLGAARIFLLGCDCYLMGEAKYHNEEVEEDARPKEAGSFPPMINEHEELRQFFDSQGLYKGQWPDSGVYNLSSFSRLAAWDKVPLDEVLR